MNDAARAYCKAQKEAMDLIQEINQSLIDDAMKQAHNGGQLRTHYGHVGDITHAKAALAEIADRLLQRGEYAPENRG